MPISEHIRGWELIRGVHLLNDSVFKGGRLFERGAYPKGALFGPIQISPIIRINMQPMLNFWRPCLLLLVVVLIDYVFIESTVFNRLTLTLFHLGGSI